jgi:hypothetical protein
VIDTCMLCGATDDDTALGWSICRGCFRLGDEPVQQWPSPWDNAARFLSILMVVFALIFLAAAIGTLAHAADCGIDAPGVCGELP